MAISAGATHYLTTVPITCLLAYQSSSFLATEYPVHLATTILLLLAVVLSLLLGLENRQHRVNGGDEKPERLKHDKRSSNVQINGFRYILIVCGALALISRIELLRRIHNIPECTVQTPAVWLPFLVSIYDALCYQKRYEAVQEEEDVDEGQYDFLRKIVRSKLIAGRWRYIPAAFLLSYGCYLVTGLWKSSKSTYICPLAGDDAVLTPKTQFLALLLDIIIIVIASELDNASRLMVVFATISANISGAWYVYRAQPENHTWLFLTDGPLDARPIWIMLGQAVILCSFIGSSLHSANTCGLLRVTVTVAAIVSTVTGLKFVWQNHNPYPPLSNTTLTWSFVLIAFSFTAFRRVRQSLDLNERPSSALLRFFKFLVFLIAVAPGLFKSNSVHFHPIDYLMLTAQEKVTSYLESASKSRSLADAVRNYQLQYNDNPPPGFNIWYDFAQNRSVTVIDEFNQVHNDLLPFRAILPADLRRLTWEMVSNPWNEISGISIRNGRARVQDNVIPTHRWMLEGVESLINSFAEHLPDMDLAFNLNDESRVAMHYRDLQDLLQVAQPLQGTIHSFSTNRSAGWLPEGFHSESDFINWSFRNTFQEWGIAGCETFSSPMSTKSSSCTTCAAKHNMGQFVADWYLAGSPCHQPDLANLHGFYTSPAAFKGSHKLMPVFSQSKVHGFNDILYPSAWNYRDKVIYAPTDTSSADNDAGSYYLDPPFSSKIPTLYWRGATSEGVSPGTGTWRGMARQRMVHETMSKTGDVVLLLRETSSSSSTLRYVYTSVPRTQLPVLNLTSSTAFVGGIARCGGIDCPAQEAEFTLVEPSDFQAHWSYKYLIDLDGAGFSGRFLPFLQSRSLVLKSALFREWWDSRVVPWAHFVPLDIRLDGLWSVLAYFEGLGQGRDGDKGHEREGELIANGGREWHDRVLTKADMEVYFFRLLLEWARLTDDRRDELGFVLGG